MFPSFLIIYKNKTMKLVKSNSQKISLLKNKFQEEEVN